MVVFTLPATSSAFAPGRRKIPTNVAGFPFMRPMKSLSREASSTRATSFSRSVEPSGLARTMMFSNSRGSARRPLVVIV